MNRFIRVYTDHDLAGLARVYRDAIRGIGAEYYTPDQIAAWSSFADDTEDFRQWIAGAATFVAVQDAISPAGFAGLEPTGRVSALFVAPEVMGQGVGAALLERVLAEARARSLTRLTTDASEFSQPLFQKSGFTLRRKEATTFKGVAFERYVMDMQIPVLG